MAARRLTRAATLAPLALLPLACVRPPAMVPASPPRLGATIAPTIPPSWSIATWAYDTQNATGCASNSNNCTSLTCGGAGTGVGPCRTWHEINDHRWGCLGSARGCPRLSQVTTVTALSSAVDTSDTINTLPELDGGSLIFTGPLGASQQVASGTVSGTIAKNRTTGQLLNVTLPVGLSAGLLISNTTSSTYAWTYNNTSGNAWEVSQPLTPVTVPTLGLLSPPTEAAWVNTNAVTAYQPVTISAAMADPIVSGLNAGVSNGIYFTHVIIDAPGDPFPAPVVFGDNVSIVEARSKRMINWRTSASAGAYFPQAINAYADIGYTTNVPSSDPTIISAGGVIGAFGNSGTINGVANFLFDGDVIFGASGVYNTGNSFGLVYVGANATLSADFGYGFAVNIVTLYNSSIIWGPGTLNIRSRLQYNSGAGAAAATFLVSNLRIHSQTRGCTMTPASGVSGCNTTVTANALDTALGTTPGCIGTPGGAAFCNY